VAPPHWHSGQDVQPPTLHGGQDVADGPVQRRRVSTGAVRITDHSGHRHYFTLNTLRNGIPITDVAEWMGHKPIGETYSTYRHVMPGSITKTVRILDAGLGEAA
jgi:integrase